MKVLLIISSLLILLVFAIYQMRIAFKSIKENEKNIADKDNDENNKS